jgi:hypothetical protein
MLTRIEYVDNIKKFQMLEESKESNERKTEFSA